MDRDAMLQVAMRAAETAGTAVMELYAGEVTVECKKDASPVTKADIAANRIIVDTLAETQIPILSEESADSPDRLERERVWIVDPLDGTMDFIQKTGDFAIMIGLAEAGRPVLGVVHVPAQDTTYYATGGEGAYRVVRDVSPERLQVSSTTGSEMRMVVSRNHMHPAMKELADELGVQEYTKLGSNGLKIAAIAEGGAEVFMNPTSKLGEWDLCAPHIIVEEAGGRLSGIAGEEVRYNKPEPRNPHGVLVTNGVTHERVLETMRAMDIAS